MDMNILAQEDLGCAVILVPERIMFSEISGFVALDRLSCNSKMTFLFVCLTIGWSLKKTRPKKLHLTTPYLSHCTLPSSFFPR